MDERMRFVIRLNDGESMASLCREFNISRRPATRFSNGMKNVGWRVSAIGRDDLSGTPTNCPSR
jgi:hypothetical protein